MSEDLKRTCITHHICDCKQAELEKLREKVRILDEGLEFYADREPWKNYNLSRNESSNNRITDIDLEAIIIDGVRHDFGGYRARTARQKARELDE